MKESKQILIIEDNRSLRLLLSHFLSKAYCVVSKPNGIEAMQWLKEGGIPDLIILDLEMPEMTGKDFLGGLKSSGFYRDIPVIIVSGNRQNILTSGDMMSVQHYFEKPFDPRKLQAKIGQLFTSNKIQFSS